MHYLIYKITNLIDGKEYIGSHRTKNIDDGYMGSGKYLKHAIEKYGLTNFKKDILFDFQTAEEMYQKEGELVNEEYLATTNTYNLKVGGFGGWDYLNDTGISKSKEKIKLAKKVQMEMYNTDPNYKAHMKKSWSKNLEKALIKRTEKYPEGTFKGKKHTIDTLNKLSESQARAQKLVDRTGNKNPNWGKKYKFIHKDSVIKKIELDQLNIWLESGWLIGLK